MNLAPPAPLSDTHRLDDFACGIPSLDDWLKRRARANQTSGASRCFVLCDGDTIAGYYALASGGVEIAGATGRFRRNMPDPIPVVVLGRLAVSSAYQRKGIGRALFRDAALRALNAADSIGIRGILVHAISEEAKAFYLALGFEPSPLDPMTLMITLGDLRAAIATS
jgi:GNAT superfamily N-acetyltransferase